MVLRTEKRNVGLCAEALCSLSIDDVTEILADEVRKVRFGGVVGLSWVGSRTVEVAVRGPEWFLANPSPDVEKENPLGSGLTRILQLSNQ